MVLWLRVGLCVWVASAAVGAQSQCPWGQEVNELQSACICAYNLGQQLSVQCDMVDFPLLLKALDKYAREESLDLLYINNSSVKALAASAFSSLQLHNLQLSGCRIKTVSPEAFLGLELTLRNLNLQDNEIDQVPIESLRNLKNLTLLDLSRNRITKVPDNAFVTLTHLSTLKLSDNNITISTEAFRGLEETLKNLNLKGTRQKRIPEAVRGLKNLAFLDLAQNGLTELPGPGGSSLLAGLDSLTALNLERNVVQKVADHTFRGVADTLSSLSLLNNLLTEFPTGAVSSLAELRVLDIGFNLLTELPVNAFLGTPSLTLLALDGNPLASIPGGALAHLNTTLRGLSLGGRFLHCDCRLRWVAEWIRTSDLQVTSRERSPQFCGTPPRFTDRNFYTITPEELTCINENQPIGVATVVNADLDDVVRNPSIIEEEELKEEDKPETTTAKRTTTSQPTTRPTRPTTSSTSTTTTTTSTTTTTTAAPTTTTEPSPQTTVTTRPTKAVIVTTTRRPGVVLSRTTVPPWPQQQRPLIRGHQPARPVQEVMVRSAHRQDNSVIIQWDSETANILGFRVVYRLFGDKSFKQGPPLEASEREFKIKNVPSQECIVVCVISLEEINVSPETVPYSQCREVRTVSSPTSHMDKITIAASAAICGTVIIAVIIFVAASRRRSRKLHTLAGTKPGLGLPMPGLPVACCPASASSPGPLSSLATLSAFTSHKDWDQVSVYSNRSLSRPRMYHMERQGSLPAPCIGDDMRYTGKPPKTRSIADGQSQHSFSNHSGRYLGNAFASGLVNSRPELRQSRQSLAVSDRLSRVSYPGSAAPHTHTHTRTRQRPRSQSRDHGGSVAPLPRPGSRYSSYGDPSADNWTDHDMDIYMARNPTTRSGLVPL